MARSLKRIALVVTYGTLLSKGGGLIRQLVIAAAFGVGAAYDAYNYAYVLPGFLLILLGGINGPFHSAMVSVLSRRPRDEGAHILAALNTTVSALLLAVTAVLVLVADPLITLVGPGLSPELHGIAVAQLQVMAPMALLAGLIGLGFGSLNAADEFWIPAISPLMSSLALIVGVGLLWWQLGASIAEPIHALWGGVVLALATLVGALASSRGPRGLARDGSGNALVGNASDQRVHGSVFCVGNLRCSSRTRLRKSSGPDPSGSDLQCITGAAVADLFAPDGFRRSSSADRQNSSGGDVVNGLHAAARRVVSGTGGADRGARL